MLKPTQLKAYIERTAKYKNSKKEYADELAAEANKLFKEITVNKEALRKPLQAVNNS